MPKLKLAAKVEEQPQPQVTLRPALKTALLNELNLYEQDYLLLKSVEDRLDQRKSRIRELRETTGESKLQIDEFTTQLIAKEGKKLNKKKLFRYITPEKYESCRESVPQRPYELIQSPRLAEDAARRRALKKEEDSDE